MSFRGKSFKKEELRMKRELQQLSRQSKSEYSDLSITDKAKLRLENVKRYGAKPVRGSRSEKTSAVEFLVGSKSERIVTGAPEVEKDQWNDGNFDTLGEIPPPSPSIELGPELRFLGTETPLTVTTPKETDLGDSIAFNRRCSDLISRSTGVPSIRSRANFSVVMQGKGIADTNDTSSAGKTRGKKSAGKPQSETPSRKTPQQEERHAKKPAIIGSQSTAVALQLTHRPTPRQTQRPLSMRSDQGYVESRLSSARFDEAAHSTTPAQLDELEDRVHSPEDNTDNSYRNDGLDMHDEVAAGNGTEAETVAGVPIKDTGRDDKPGGADSDSKREDSLPPNSGKVEGAKRTNSVGEEEDENQIDRIHSEILELTRKISLPDAGILKLIRASEEATDKAQNKQDTGGGSVPSKQSLLLRALAQQGGTDFAVSGALKSMSPPRVSRTPNTTRKNNEEAQGGQSSVTDKEDLLKIPRKDARATLVNGGTSGKVSPGLGGGPSGSDRGMEEGMRELTDRGILASQSGDDFLARQEHIGQKPVTDEQALESLLLPLKVVPEDIIGIKGQQVEITSKGASAPVNSVADELKKQWIQVKDQKDVSFLDSWQIKESDKEKQPVKTHNIHHFCTMPSRIELPPHLCRVTRDEHTRDRFPMVTGTQAGDGFKENLPEVNEEETEDKDGKENEDGSSDINKQKDTEARRRSLAAEKILREASELGDSIEAMTRLIKASDTLLCSEVVEPLDVVGVKMELRDDSSRLYWTPAPPKMNLAPATIKSQLYPAYQGGSMLRESLVTEHRTATGIDSDDNDETQADHLDSGDPKAKTRILSREHGSMSDLHKLVAEAEQVQRPKTDLGGVRGRDSLLQTQEINDSEERAGNPDRFMSLLDRRREHIKQQDEELREDDLASAELMDKNMGPTVLRSKSHPQLFVNETFLQVPAGYDISMDELNYQRDQVAALKAKRQEKGEKYGEKDAEQMSREKSHTAVTVSSHGRSTMMDFPEQGREFDSDGARTETEHMSAQTATSRATGLTKTSRRRLTHRRVRRKTKKDLEREQEIYEFVNQPARLVSRSNSLTERRSLEKKEKESYAKRKESVSSRVDLGRANSVPTYLDLEKFLNEDLSGPSDEVFDDIRQRFWYVWFDEVYPPTPPALEIKFDLRSLSTPRAESRSKASVVIVSNDILDDIQVIEPRVSSTDKQLYQALQEEVVTLTDLIDSTVKKESCAIHLCRRGAVYRKLGELKKAWDDLNRSIELEPKLLDAYWYRHLLHLLQDNVKAALADLTFIIKNNSTQARAFRSRAELYRQESDATMAIVNYSQAIKLDPNDAETYYRRAAMFKMRGDMILALEDYKIAAKLLPSKTDAMFEIGVYHFNNQNWIAAVNDFTEVLRQDPEDSKAYSHRARVHAKMDNHDAALKDLAAAVHHDPQNAVAFYHRGCLLRKVHPKRALQDFSVSLLLDSSLDNVHCFLHRGILYTDLQRWEDAVPDFEAALHLDSTLACAHVNIGLIYIIKYSNHHKAVRRFTAAIRVDPTYIRAYICRAEAYHKLHLLQEAFLDYTRAIHMRPDVSDYHIARGKLLLEQNKLELASFHVRQAADLNQGLGASATQQAVVQSFLRNFEQAIDVLERATRVRPVAPLFILLGKTNMKAKRFQKAINSFEKAIEIMTPWNRWKEMPLEAASVHFLIGMCQSELGRPLGALDAFNNAIRVNPDYAEAFYQRGLTKMKLKHAKGIHDFNRALAINSGLFQAFLSRAAYYGMRGRYSKGIMSCNEAIKLQPRSVRAYLYRGALKYNIKAYKLAVKDLTEAVAIDCKCSLAFFNRAVCYHEMKFFQKALMDYGTVMLLEEKPNIKVLQNRGLLYFEIDDVENALYDFLAASKISPDDPNLRHTLGLCYHRLNRLEEAVSSYNDALRVDPFFVEAYNGRGNALMDFGHEDGTVLGRRDYLKALHMDPVCLSARVNLGYNLQVEGKFQAAWNQFSAAIIIDSACQSALEGRAVVNLQMANTFGAFVDMNDAIKISKSAELLTNRGVVQQFMGDYVNAIRDYQAAVKLDPSYALAYYNAANVYFRQRQFQQALHYYDKALSWYADDESAVLNRAITKVMVKDSKGALKDFNRAVELNPYAAHVYFNRGNLYASLRKYKESEDDYTRALSLRPGDALVYKRRADVLGKQGKKAAAIEDYKKAIVVQTSKY